MLKCGNPDNIAMMALMLCLSQDVQKNPTLTALPPAPSQQDIRLVSIMGYAKKSYLG